MSELVVGSIAGLAANSYVVDVASGSSLDLTNATGLPSSALPTGSVLQVVSTTKTDSFSSSSTSYTDITGLSVAITPSSATSKILVIVHSTLNANNCDTLMQLVRDSTPIANGTSGTVDNGIGQAAAPNPLQNMSHQVSMTHLDSPATTSSTTYKLQARCGSAGTLYVNNRAGLSFGVSSSITVMEIAG